MALDSHVEFMQGRRPDLDGLILSAKEGAAWTLRYPEYAVVVPRGVEVRVPLVYPVASDAADLGSFLKRWAELAERDGTAAEMYAHWVLGESVVRRGSRWSNIRDVLHWID